MATGLDKEGYAFFRCEKCGRYEKDFPNQFGIQDQGLAQQALKQHVLGKHNKGG